MPFNQAVAVDEGHNLPAPVLARLRAVLVVPRVTSTIITDALPPGDRKVGTLDIGDEFQLISFQTSSKARLRLYTTAAARTADLGRAPGTDPTGNHGVILDVLLVDNVKFNLSPQVIGSTDGEPVIYYALDNYDSVARVITATLISRNLE